MMTQHFQWLLMTTWIHQIHYNNASMAEIGETAKWNSMLRSSLLASLRFINKHWLICGGTDKDKFVFYLSHCVELSMMDG